MDWSELSELSDREVIALYDRAAEHANGGLSFFHAELARREAARQSRTMIRLTWAVAVMTAAVVALTVVLLLAE
jgi:hypothetical protein